MSLPRTVLMLPLDEVASTAPPTDAAGQLDPLTPPTGLEMPDVVDGWTGPTARDFVAADATGLEAVDATDGLTLAPRDCSIECLVSIRAESVASWPRTIVQRGRGGSAAERINYRLTVQELGSPASPQHLEVTLDWEDAAGNLVSPSSGATFLAPAESAFLHLVATRRVERDLFVTRYYVDGELIGEADAPVAGVGGATTGHTLVGVGYDPGAPGYDYHWDGIVDELRVVDYEMSPEEVRATWDRLTRHQPDAVAATAASMPPGSGWGADPETRWGRLVRIAGEALGQGLASIEALRANWLPDRAYQGWLDRWERLVAASPKRRESLDVRRARVVDLLGRDNGFAVPQLETAFSDSMDLAAADVEILEYSNLIAETWDTLEECRWEAGADGSWAVAAGEVRVDLSAGGDARYEDGYRNQNRLLTPLSSGRGRLVLQTQITDYVGDLPADVLIGLQLLNKRTTNALWVGVKNLAGTLRFGYVSRVDNATGLFSPSGPTMSTEPLWIRIIRDPTGLAREDSASTTYRLSYSTTGPDSGYTDLDVADLLPDPEWGGLGVVSSATWGAAGGLGATFDDTIVFTPRGTRPFHWYAYRDPGLPGAPHMPRSHALALRMRPAHTEAGAIQSLEVLCDDAELGLCDHGPCGGL